MNGFFRDDKGNKSMNRLLAFMGGCTGTAVALAGSCGWLFKSLSDSAVVIGLGLAVFGGSQYLKNQGRKLENGEVK